MSLILDALRKSEAERRRGDAPDLFAPMPAVRPVARSRPALVPVLAITAVLAVIGFAWWRAHPAPPPDVSAPRIAPVPTADTAPAGPTLETPHAARPAASPRPTPLPRMTTAPTAPSAAPVAAAVANRPASPASPIPAVQPEPSPPFAARPAADLTPDSARPTDTRSAAASGADARLPRLGELDTVRRANLPPLKLSMHVWDENPDHRFAIIDGQRVIEGSELGGTLVHEIRRDGVVLTIDGRDYLLPR